MIAARRFGVQSRLSANVLWSAFGAASSQGFALFASILTARILGKNLFGEFGFIQTTIASLTVFAAPAIGITATTFIARYRDSDPARAGRIIALTNILTYLMSIFVSMAALVIATLFSPIFGNREASNLITLGVAVMFVSAVNGAQYGVLAGLGDFAWIAKINVIKGAVTFIAVPVLAHTSGLGGAVVGLFTVSLTAIAFTFWRINCSIEQYKCFPNYRGCRSEISLLWSASLPALVGSVIGGLTLWAGPAVIFSAQNGQSEMGLFSAANNWGAFLMFLPGILLQPFLSQLSSYVGCKQWTELWETARKYLRVSLVVSAVPAFFVMCLSSQLLSAYGDTFSEARKSLIVLCAYAVFASVAGAAGYVLMSLGKIWLTVLLNLIWAVLFICTLFLLRSLGAFGLASTFAISYFFHSVICLAALRIVKSSHLQEQHA